MKLITLVTTVFSLTNLITAIPVFSQSTAFIGTGECNLYQGSRDPISPLRRMISASFNVDGSGYVLKVTYDREDKPVFYYFDSNLQIKNNESNHLKISSNGKFEFGINDKSEWCKYSGVAQISPEVSTKLFGDRTVQSIEGTWKWRCCQDKYWGTFELFQDENRISGTFNDLSNGTGGNIIGTIRESKVEFTRSGNQFFALTLSSDGQTLEGTLSGSRDTSVGTKFIAKRQR
jgi:hypothetical protein